MKEARMGQISYGLQDKVVLITGGSRGIGLEIARYCLAENAAVVICGRKQDGLDAAVESLGEPGEDVLAVPAHIGKEDDVDRLFALIEESFSRLDVLINNVGMNIMTASIVDTEPSLWRKIIDTNLTGTYLCSRKAAALMKRQKGGKIVTISSVAARRATSAMGVYGVAKAGVEMMTAVLAAELAADNIQVNAVAPAMVRTDFSRPFWSNESLYKDIVSTIPMGRIADPVDVVHPVLFLASEGAGFITGQTIVVDGGATII